MKEKKKLLFIYQFSKDNKLEKSILVFGVKMNTHLYAYINVIFLKSNLKIKTKSL